MDQSIEDKISHWPLCHSITVDNNGHQAQPLSTTNCTICLQGDTNCYKQGAHKQNNRRETNIAERSVRQCTCTSRHSSKMAETHLSSASLSAKIFSLHLGSMLSLASRHPVLARHHPLISFAPLAPIDQSGQQLALKPTFSVDVLASWSSIRQLHINQMAP